ncbi:ABC transporter permease [Pedococcus sp. KACC 23699]|uniref:ABC transporter permease n=1 Tax=Pedococcus sp. KACC 23699 TaxID=3149228 RepID=A0AAU7JQ47_9MICO
MTALAITTVSLRRMVRDRTSMFFVVLLPVLVILVIGVTVGGRSGVRVAVVDLDRSAVASGLVHDLDTSRGITLVHLPDIDAARTAVRRGQQDVAVVVPAHYGARLLAGLPATLTTIDTSAAGNRQAADTAVGAVVGHHAAQFQAAAFATAHSGRDVGSALALARRLQTGVPTVAVRTDVVNGASDILPAGFGYSAPTMLVLFVFVNALAGGAAMIQTRGLKLYDRIMAAPVRPLDVVLGEGCAYLLLALLQSALIVGVGVGFFGVSWGNPWAAGALVAVWALVGMGAGMLSGTLFRTPEQASAIGPALGIGLGMLGGCMWPLAIVSPAMRTIGHVAPQAWAVDAWTIVISRGGDVASIALELGVLAAFAIVLVGLASFRFHRSLTG